MYRNYKKKKVVKADKVLYEHIIFEPESQLLYLATHNKVG